MIRRPPRSPLFPSPTLFRSNDGSVNVHRRRTATSELDDAFHDNQAIERQPTVNIQVAVYDQHSVARRTAGDLKVSRDRKSTRLNSSHLVISYAVFCLKKKNK